MSVDDIMTAVGYPIQFNNTLHCRTILIFTFRRDNELCLAVDEAGAGGSDDGDGTSSDSDSGDDDSDDYNDYQRRKRKRRDVRFTALNQLTLEEDQRLLKKSIVAAIADYNT